MRSLLTFFAALIMLTSAAQTGSTTIEFFKTDITKLTDFKGNDVSFFGLKKGMSKAAAVKVLNTLDQFTWKYDKWNTKSEDVNSTTETRIYVSLKAVEGDPSILYLIWKERSPKMTSMVVYGTAEQYAVGDTKKLFTTEAISGNADFLKFLKGSPVVTKGNYTTEYSYPSQNFSFTSYVDTENKTKIWFSFIDK